MKVRFLPGAQVLGKTAKLPVTPTKEPTMCNIKVGRYKDPNSVGWSGWLEPENKSWIMFINLEGQPTVFLNRDPQTGACMDHAEACAVQE